jgi:hypothetical protein
MGLYQRLLVSFVRVNFMPTLPSKSEWALGLFSYQSAPPQASIFAEFYDRVLTLLMQVQIQQHILQLKVKATPGSWPRLVGP